MEIESFDGTLSNHIPSSDIVWTKTQGERTEDLGKGQQNNCKEAHSAVISH